MIKAIIFDLDDTLISELEYIKSGFKVVCGEISDNFGLNKKELQEEIYEIFEEDSNNVFNRLLDKYDLNYELSYIKNLVKIYRNHKPNINLYPDAKKILDYLYGKYKLGLITDGYENSQNQKIEAVGIYNIIDEIVITDELGRDHWKPDEMPYKLCVNNLEVDYGEAIYIGDNIKKDFITANKLGMNTVQIIRKDGIYNEINRSEKYRADYKVTDLQEIISIYNL